MSSDHELPAELCREAIESPPESPGIVRSVSSRRRFLGQLGTIAGIGLTASSPLAQTATQPLVPNGPAVPSPADTTEMRLPVSPLDAKPGPVTRPSFVKDVSRLINLDRVNQGGPYWNYTTYQTPIEDFFIRNSYPSPRPELDPRIARDTWRLRIHGNGIEREITLTYNDLLKMPSRTVMATLECAGNGRSLFWEQEGMTEEPTKVGGTGWGLGGIGQAEWQLVPMSHILALVGLKKDAKQALFWSGVDNKEGVPGVVGDSGRPMPVSVIDGMSDTCGLAFKMNGQDLPADHGAPVRFIAPGWCGAASVKWLTEIKIATHDFWVRLNSTQHVMIGPSYTVPKPAAGDEFRGIKPTEVLGPMVEWAPPRSLLTIPLVLEKQPKFPHNYPLNRGQWPVRPAGRQTLRGYTWAPEFGVRRIEVRINKSSWQQARMIDPAFNTFTWRRFEFDWTAAPGDYVIETRTTDMKGNKQPESVPFNKGGFDYWGIPKFKVRVV